MPLVRTSGDLEYGIVMGGKCHKVRFCRHHRRMGFYMKYDPKVEFLHKLKVQVVESELFTILVLEFSQISTTPPP